MELGVFKAIHGRMQLRGLASRGALHMDCPQGLSPSVPWQ